VGANGSAAADGRPESAGPFSARVHLTKGEAFDACQALADADRVLVAVGGMAEADALGDLFELLEDRLTTPGQESVGSNSMEREFTQ
jgi:hypothetical protein